MNVSKIFFDKTFKRSLFAFLFLVLLMLIISSYIYTRSVNNLSNEIENNNLLVVENVTQHMNGVFKELNNTFMSIELMRTNIIVSDSGDIETKQELKDVFNNLASIMSEKSYINEIVLMSKNSNINLTSKGSIDFKVFFEQMYSNPQYMSKFWKDFTTTRHKTIVIRDSIYTDKISGFNEQRNLFALVNSTLMNKSNFISVIFVDTNIILSNFNHSGEKGGVLLSIYDNEGNIIITSDDNASNISKEKILLAPSGISSIIANKTKYYISKSDYNGYLYLVRFPDSSGTNFVIDFSVLLIIMSLILGVLLAIVFSVYINKPLKNIISMFNFQGKESVSDSAEFLENKIANMLAENKENTVKIKEIKDEVKISLFMKIINSSSYYNKNSSIVNTIFEDVSDYQSIMLIALEISKTESENKTNYNIAMEIAQKTGLPCVVIEENAHNYIYIIGFNPDSNDKNNVCKAFIKASSPYSEKNRCSLFVSAVYESLSGLYEAYGDLRTCREYRIVGKNSDIIDINTIDPSGVIYLPDEAKNKIHNFILAGMKNECIEIIESIINKNIESGIFCKRYKILINTLYFIVADALMLSKCDNNDIMMMEQMIARQMNNPAELSAEKTTRIFSNIIRLNVGNENTAFGSKLNMASITQYINENYDKDLYLENMSKLFGTTPKYFSNFFSRECKESFTVYLTNIRMAKAKEFITQTDMKINDIAEKVGYANATTFTNTFKKYNGFSPTQYREIKGIKN